jgi:Arc/MetJ-type ribon-helix-helix transcriptional regulator
VHHAERGVVKAPGEPYVCDQTNSAVHATGLGLRGVMTVQRKSFVFPQDVSERLDRLTSTTRLESNSSVVRLALVVLEDLVAAIANGEKILLQDENGETRAYNPFVAPGKVDKGKQGQSQDAA